MKTRFSILAMVAILTLALSACNNPRAEAAGVWYNPLSWGDRTLAASLEIGCVGGAKSVVVDGATYDCPVAAEAADYQGEAAAYSVTNAYGWPVDFGENRKMTVNALGDNHDLVVNYGREGFDTSGQQVQVCGTAVVLAGESLDLVFWAGNAEAVTAGYGFEYANFTYANRKDAENGDSKCQAWETVGFTPATATDQP